MGTRKLIHGVGINDAEYPVVKHEYVEGIRKIVWRCPFYTRWSKMITRCYSSVFTADNPAYEGCSVCKEWHKFSSFKSWMGKQIWEGLHLDKDILLEGNKVYSPSTCAFVSKTTNNFILDRSAPRGEGMLGVLSRNGRFMTRCLDKYLGTYDTSEEANAVWRKFKHDLACKLANEQTDLRVAEALRRRYL